MAAIQIDAASRLLISGTAACCFSQIGAVLVLMVPEVRGLGGRFMLAIRSHRSPAELERQKRKHDDGKPTTHAAQSSSDRVKPYASAARSGSSARCVGLKKTVAACALCHEI